MKRFWAYIKDVIQEFTQKVNWPKWSDLQTSALIVMVASIILSVFIFLLDLAFFTGMKGLYGIFF